MTDIDNIDKQTKLNWADDEFDGRAPDSPNSPNSPKSPNSPNSPNVPNSPETENTNTTKPPVVDDVVVEVVENPETPEKPEKRRGSRKISTDPRTIGFTMGPKRQHIRDFAEKIRHEKSDTIFMKYVSPYGNNFGYWNCLSNSTEILDQAETWLRDKEQECIQAIIDGSFIPRTEYNGKGGKGGKGNKGKGNNGKGNNGKGGKGNNGKGDKGKGGKGNNGKGNKGKDDKGKGNKGKDDKGKG
jgi:hypothetical protein